MTTARQTDVLIVGAGPVGATAALLCARLGLRTIVVEKRERRRGPPKAHALNPRSLEIYRALGIARERFAELAMPRDDGGFVRFVTRLDGLELGVLPYERQDDGALEATPTPLLNVPQPALEDLLLDELERQPSIELHRPATWSGATEQGDRVKSTVTSDGRSFPVSSRYLLACDGAESPVRKSLGIAMPGNEAIEDRIMIHFEADLRPLLRDRPGVLYFIADPSAPATLIAYDLASTYVLMHRYDSRREPSERFTQERCAALIRRAIGEGIDFNLRHISPWTMTALLAERYRQGRTFLCGDAAHRFPPSGGLGLNSGLQDVHNLIWKIAGVEKRWSEATLLIDSYERERRPVAAAYSAQSHGNAERMRELFAYVFGQYAAAGGDRCAGTEQLASADCAAELQRLVDLQRPHFDSFGLQLGFRYGDDRWSDHVSDFSPSILPGVRLPHAWIEIEGRRASTLDLVDLADFVLIVSGPGSAWRDAAAESGVPLRIKAAGTDFADRWQNWERLAGRDDAHAVLVRPDGHIVWIAREANRTTISGLLGTLRDPVCA